MVYLNVHQLLKSGIMAGYYQQGERLPSEVDLASQFNVSRNTLRKALKLLQNAGFIECRHGAGNFVSQKGANINFLYNLKGFSEIVGTPEISASSQVLKFEIQPATPAIANALALKFKDQVYYISRLRCLNDLPVELENSWVSAEKFPDLTLSYVNGSLYDYFENICQVSISGAFLHYSPLQPSAELSILLNLNKNTPIIKVQSQSVDRMNRPFLYSENYTNFLEYPIKMFVPRKHVTPSLTV